MPDTTQELPNAEQCMKASHRLTNAGESGVIAYYTACHSESHFEFHRKEMLRHFQSAALELGFELKPIHQPQQKAV